MTDSPQMGPYIPTRLDEAAIAPPMVTPVLDDLRARYGAALARYATEPIRFELFMFPVPTAQRDNEGNHQLIAMLGLYVEIASAVLREQPAHVTATRTMQPNGHTDDVIDSHARELVAGLMGARRQELLQAEADARAAHERGEEPPVSGLIRADGRPNGQHDLMQQAVQEFVRRQ